jgi:hypothetical protein
MLGISACVAQLFAVPLERASFVWAAAAEESSGSISPLRQDRLGNAIEADRRTTEVDAALTR